MKIYNLDQTILTQDKIKFATIMVILTVADLKVARPKTKSIDFDFGLSWKILKSIMSELVEKSSYSNYLTNDPNYITITTKSAHNQDNNMMTEDYQKADNWNSKHEQSI